MQVIQNPRARVIGVKFNIVANGIGGEEPVDATRGKKVFGDDFVKELVGFGKDLPCLFAILLVIENAGVDTFQLPRSLLEPSAEESLR